MKLPVTTFVDVADSPDGFANYLQQLATAIAAGWNVEHLPDGTHGFTWTNVPFNASYFTSPTGSWTVTADNVLTFAFIRMGRLMTVSLILQYTKVSGTPAYLEVQIPGEFVAALKMVNACSAVDNGTAGLGFLYVEPGIRSIRVARQGLAAWSDTGGVGLTIVEGQVTFEVEA